MNPSNLNILDLSASARGEASKTRRLSRELIDSIASDDPTVDVVQRDLRLAIPFVDEAWVTANFTADDDRNDEQRAVLALSDELIGELKQADVIVIGTPIYNFSIPAALKAWIDLVARARVTFRYTSDGPVGLLQNKKAFLVVASGGVAVGSDVDFATPYLRHALRFIGITDVEIIAAERVNSNEDGAMQDARATLVKLARQHEQQRKTA